MTCALQTTSSKLLGHPGGCRIAKERGLNSATGRKITCEDDCYEDNLNFIPYTGKNMAGHLRNVVV